MFIVIIIIFCEEDVVLFLNAVERNFQSFNLSSAVQFYNRAFGCALLTEQHERYLTIISRARIAY